MIDYGTSIVDELIGPYLDQLVPPSKWLTLRGVYRYAEADYNDYCAIQLYERMRSVGFSPAQREQFFMVQRERLPSDVEKLYQDLKRELS